MGKFQGFSSVQLRKPNRSTFDLSHEKRISSRVGKLTPCLITETLPGDSFYGSTEVLVKLAPLIAPIYHRLNLYVHYFFVPNRLLWVDWENFITGGRLGPNVTMPPVPPRSGITELLTINDDILDVGSVADYMGVPPIPDADVSLWASRTLDSMPFAAFYKCWYDYYRDRNYVADNDLLPMASGFIPTVNSQAFLIDKYRCWEHDYFTSSQLSTQRGSEVLMPLAGTGSVTYLEQGIVTAPSAGDPATGNIMNDSANFLVDSASNAINIQNIDEVELTSSDVSINDLRRAVRLQEWLERNQLAGSRYTESNMAHFAVKSSDARLQRAEYLGGGKAVIQISEVMTTAYSEDDASAVVPPGNPAGRGSTYADTNKFSYRCEEHGFIIGVLSVLPTSGYMQGLPRMFGSRNTFLDYPWPSFAHLGEQEVRDYEIFFDPTSYPSDRNAQPLFGYQSRYADWKFISSSSHGDFRTSLDFWHLTRKFATLPTLSAGFMTYDDENQDRIFNVTAVDTLWMYVYNKLNVKRALPYFGTPML